MKYSIVLLMLISLNCNAGNYLTLTIASKHFKDENLNEINPGIGINLNGYLLGQFKNSFEENSIYAGYQFEKKVAQGFSVGANVGLITGYADDRLETPNIGSGKLFVLPHVTFINKKVNYILGVIPINSRAITFQIDVLF